VLLAVLIGRDDVALIDSAEQPALAA
jgi:hypothetical protein